MTNPKNGEAIKNDQSRSDELIRRGDAAAIARRYIYRQDGTVEQQINAIPAALDPDAVAEYVHNAQMVQEAVQAEREACAVVADILETEWWGEYKNIMSPHAYDPQYQGMSDGAGEVAAAIRARGEARLRAQLAEAQAERDGLAVDLGFYTEDRDFHKARAERAEAALAAQIELDAGMIDAITAEASKGVLLGGARDRAVLDMMKSLSAAIRNQPHDRTALDRMLADAREKALREAAELFGDSVTGRAVARCILALIEKEKAE